MLLSGNAFAAMKVDGRFSEWAKVPKICSGRKDKIEKSRSGIDFDSVAMRIEGKFLYMFIKGRSISSGEADKGRSLSEVSIRTSFVSASNPLNRVRVATDPKIKRVIRISQPAAETKQYGSMEDGYWRIGTADKGMYGIEMKVPVFTDKEGTVYVGSKGGPVIRKKMQVGKRKRVCDVFIINVNTKTHVFIDQAKFSIYNNSI